MNKKEKQARLDYLKTEVANTPLLERGGKTVRNFSDKFKKEVLDYHYQFGLLITGLAIELDINAPSLYVWKKQFGSDRTAVMHGTTTRNDVRTKALAVQRYYNGETAYALAEAFNVTPTTIAAWSKQYKDKYEEYLDLPDGVTVIAKEERQIYGDANIKQVEQMLKDNNERLTELLNTMHMTTTEKNIIKKLKEKNEKKQDKLDQAKETIEDLGLKIK